MNNPLLQEQDLPLYSQVRPEHIEPALEKVISDNKETLGKLLASGDQQNDWDSLMLVLDNMEDRLDSLWSIVSHLFSVNNNAEIRAVYDRCLPLVTEYATELSQNEALYQRIDALRARATELDLTASQIKVLDDHLLDFKLAGVALDVEKKQRFKELQQRLSQLSSKFSNNVLDATHDWSRHITDREQLSGLPEIALSTAESAAQAKDLDGYLLTLDFPCFNAVITYADNEELRQQIYTGFVTRASDQNTHNDQWDNGPIIDEILALRREKAELLGFDSYAALSLATKMADSTDKVVEFLNELLGRGKPFAEREFRHLEEFAATHGKTELQAWDIAYYSEKLRKQLYDLSQEELREYFPIEQVKKGLFEIVSSLFGISIRPNSNYETWHPSVEAFDIYYDEKLIARFFIDLYTRDSKRGGAWMSGCRTRRIRQDDSLQLPAAYLVCNFSAGDGDKPALLTHTEVTTLFHEFGHGLHHLLTRESELRVSGINGVAWDAVELPSQLMENWCWNADSIKLISSHYESGEPLPVSLLEKMLAARNFQAGIKMMRQLEFGLFDFELHRDLNDLGPGYVRDKMKSVRDRTAVFSAPDFNRFENSFSHIFAGGYAAGYYSYFWAEVLSADVFSKFDEEGVMNSSTGKRYLEKILSRGGARKALELFKDFMGREPQIDALLNQKGITSG